MPPRPDGTTAVVLSGGNVDAGLLADVTRRHETQAGRRLVLLARLSDRPGALARLLALVAEPGANLRDVQHIREGIDLHVRETAVQLVLETRGRAHAEAVIEAVRSAGYPEPEVLRATRPAGTAPGAAAGTATGAAAAKAVGGGSPQASGGTASR